MRTLTVGDLMTEPAVMVSAKAEFKDIAEMLDEFGIGSVPVVDQHDRPVGVVSESDLLAWQASPGAVRRRWWGRKRRSAGSTAADLLSRGVRTIGRGEPASVAARALAESGYRRLYVVNQSGYLVGVLAKRDVLRMFLRSDTELAEQIEQDVLRRCLWAGPGAAAATVDKGRVRLTGTLDRRSEVERATLLVDAIPGVVSVDNELGFVVDDVVAT